jgi:hypothetical protein
LGETGEPFDADGAGIAGGARWQDHLEAVEQGYERPRPKLAAAFDDRLGKDSEGIFWTDFPPPGDEPVTEQGEYGEEGYCRTLTGKEQRAVTRDLDKRRDREAAERDRFFGLEK